MSLFSAAQELMAFFQRMFIQREARRATNTKTSKHRPFDDTDTGPDAAIKFASRHPPIPDRASSIRKIQCADRIRRGLRPLRYGVSGPRERKSILRSIFEAAK